MKAWKHKTNADDIRVVLPDNESLWVFFEPVRVILEGTYARQQATLAAAEAKFTAIRLAATDDELNELVSETQMIELINQIRAAKEDL